jgi:hypothetical protein
LRPFLLLCSYDHGEAPNGMAYRRERSERPVEPVLGGLQWIIYSQ